jgi:hypothetical protein
MLVLRCIKMLSFNVMLSIVLTVACTNQSCSLKAVYGYGLYGKNASTDCVVENKIGSFLY